MNLSEKVAYLRGLADGLDIDSDTDEGRVLSEMIDILEDFADAIAGLEEYVEEIDDDLSDVEEVLFNDLDDFDDDDYDFDFYDDDDFCDCEDEEICCCNDEIKPE